MVNEVILVGVIKQIEDADEFKKNIKLNIERQFRDGYERKFDTILCKYWKSIFEKVIKNIDIGDTVAIKGRIEEENNSFVVMIENFVLLNKTKHNVLKTK